MNACRQHISHLFSRQSPKQFRWGAGPRPPFPQASDASRVGRLADVQTLSRLPVPRSHKLGHAPMADLTAAILIGALIGIAIGVALGWYLRRANRWCPQCGGTLTCSACADRPHPQWHRPNQRWSS
jgi:hypothetical protein